MGNTVEYNGKKISQEEKEKIVEFLFANEKPEFKKIRKVICKKKVLNLNSIIKMTIKLWNSYHF